MKCDITALQQAWDRIATSRAAVAAHPDLGKLPDDTRFPRIHSRLVDGRLSPASVVTAASEAVAREAPAKALQEERAAKATAEAGATIRLW